MEVLGGISWMHASKMTESGNSFRSSQKVPVEIYGTEERLISHVLALNINQPLGCSTVKDTGKGEQLRKGGDCGSEE
jgi:hypothetical protein